MRTFFAIALTLTAALAIATDAGAQSRDGKDRRVRVNNNTSHTMVALHGSSIRSKSWEENMIAGRPVPSGNSIVANFDDGTGECMFDLQAVFSNGSKAEKRRVNVCVEDTWTIVDGR